MFKNSMSLGSELGDFAKDIGKMFVRGFGRILGTGIAAGLFGGLGGGILAAMNDLPIIGFAIGGAVVAAVLVYAIWLFALSDY